MERQPRPMNYRVIESRPRSFLKYRTGWILESLGQELRLFFPHLQVNPVFLKEGSRTIGGMYFSPADHFHCKVEYVDPRNSGDCAYKSKETCPGKPILKASIYYDFTDPDSCQEEYLNIHNLVEKVINGSYPVEPWIYHNFFE